MINGKKVKYNTIYNIIITLFSIVLGVTFILFSYTILIKGKNAVKENPLYTIYNIEIVKTYLNILIAPFILWVLIIISGIVIKHVFKIEDKENINQISTIDTYNVLCKKVKYINDNSLLKDISKERKKRLIIFISVSIIALLLMIFPARYLFTKANFPGENTNNEIKKMVLNVLPFIAINFILFGGYVYYYLKSINKEIILLRDIVKYVKAQPIIKSKKQNNQLYLNITRGAIFITSITFIVLGIFNGGYKDVLVKAINICTECVGLA